MFVKKVMNIKYDSISNTHETQSIVYLLQEIPGTRKLDPKYNITGAQKYGKIKVLLKEGSQIVFSPGPAIFELRRLYGKFKVLKWDRQERTYYPLEINLYEKGKIDD